MANANYNYSLTIGAQLKDTQQIKSQLDKFGESYKLKINVELKSDKLDLLSKRLQEVSTAMNSLRGSTNNVNNSLKNVETPTGELRNGLGQVNTNIENVNTNLQNLGRGGRNNLDRLDEGQQRLNQHTRTFGDILRTVYQFYIASLPARAMETMVRETINAVKEFDSALTEFKKVSDLSGQSLQNYTKELSNLGLTVARTGSEMVEMAGNFKKAGFTEDEAKQLSVVASMYQNVADSEIEAGDAANYVTSQIKAFHLEAKDAQNIIDQLNIVSNNFAVSSTDISTALSKTASAMSTLGNDMAQTIGLTNRN